MVVLGKVGFSGFLLGKVGFSGFLLGNRENLGNYGVILVAVCILKAYFREKYEYFSISIYRSVVLFVF